MHMTFMCLEAQHDMDWCVEGFCPNAFLRLEGGQAACGQCWDAISEHSTRDLHRMFACS